MFDNDNDNDFDIIKFHMITEYGVTPFIWDQKVLTGCYYVYMKCPKEHARKFVEYTKKYKRLLKILDFCGGDIRPEMYNIDISIVDEISHHEIKDCDLYDPQKHTAGIRIDDDDNDDNDDDKMSFTKKQSMNNDEILLYSGDHNLLSTVMEYFIRNILKWIKIETNNRSIARHYSGNSKGDRRLHCWPETSSGDSSRRQQ